MLYCHPRHLPVIEEVCGKGDTIIVTQPDHLNAVGVKDVFAYVTPMSEPMILPLVREIERLIGEARMRGMLVMHIDKTHANARIRRERGY